MTTRSSFEFAPYIAQLLGPRPTREHGECDPGVGLWCIACGTHARQLGGWYCATCEANKAHALHRSTPRHP